VTTHINLEFRRRRPSAGGLSSDPKRPNFLWSRLRRHRRGHCPCRGMQADLPTSGADVAAGPDSYGTPLAPASEIPAAPPSAPHGRPPHLQPSALPRFTVASAACACGPDVSVLSAARTGQGLGGARVPARSAPLTSLDDRPVPPPNGAGRSWASYGGLAGLAVKRARRAAGRRGGPQGLTGATGTFLEKKFNFRSAWPLSGRSLRCCRRATGRANARPGRSRAGFYRRRPWRSSWAAVRASPGPVAQSPEIPSPTPSAPAPPPLRSAYRSPWENSRGFQPWSKDLRLFGRRAFGESATFTTFYMSGAIFAAPTSSPRNLPFRAGITHRVSTGLRCCRSFRPCR